MNGGLSLSISLFVWVFGVGAGSFAGSFLGAFLWSGVSQPNVTLEVTCHAKEVETRVGLVGSGLVCVFVDTLSVRWHAPYSP